MKNIIKRIIVGIIIGLVLMACRKYLFVNARALEVNHVAPDGLGYCLTEDSCGLVDMTTYAPSGLFTTFYGFGWGAYNRLNMYWAFPSAGNYNTPVDIHFTIYNQNVYDDDIFPFQVMIKDDNGSLFTCNVNSSNSTLNISSGTRTTTALYTNVLCENIALSSSRFRVILGSRFDTGYGGNGVVAISPLTIYEHSSTSAVTGAINNASSSVTNSVDDLNDSINDDTISSDTDNDISDLQNTDVSSTEDAGIQDLITLPIELFNGILSALNGSCTPYRIGTLLGVDIILPCFYLGGVLGSVWNVIDIVISSCIFFKFATKLKEIFINLTSLNENKGDLIE